MVAGLETFQRKFSDYHDQYALIGGTAAYLVLDQAGLESRATKDLDIVLCLELLNSNFAKAFWEFIQDGGYEDQQKSTGEKRFYRFSRPASSDYPFMLELFSRSPDNFELSENSHLTPIPAGEDVASLSAILLDEDYYKLIHEHKTVVNGVSLVNEVCLIPLKAYAWLDLSRRKDAGEQVDSKSIKKHESDALRLSQLLPMNEQIAVRRKYMIIL